MGCSSCGKVSNISQVQRIVKKNTSGVCTYDAVILNDWLSILKCVKENTLFSFFNTTSQKINSYLGIVQSSLNYSTNLCYFRIRLDEIKILIDTIKASDRC